MFVRSRRYAGISLGNLSQRDHVLAVQAAFLLRRFLPPPTSSALVLVGAHSPGAGLAAHRDKASVVQRVVGYLVVAYVLPNFCRRPER